MLMMTLKMTLNIHLKFTQENDYYEITGSLDSIAKNVKSFNSVTQESDKLLLYYTCNWLKGGISVVEIPDFIYNADVYFYNNGQCINKYSIITNETLFEKAYDAKFN